MNKNTSRGDDVIVSDILSADGAVRTITFSDGHRMIIEDLGPCLAGAQPILMEGWMEIYPVETTGDDRYNDVLYDTSLALSISMSSDRLLAAAAPAPLAWRLLETPSC